MAVTVIVPLKALSQAKRRLSDTFSPAQRRELVTWMFDRVIAAVLGMADGGPVLVVAGDAAAAAVAARRGVQVWIEPAPGLGPALASADARATEAGAEATMVVAADLPLVTSGDLDAVAAAGVGGACVVVAPTRDGGTAALLRRPATVIPTAYGPASAQAHLRLARAGGVRAVRLDLDALAVDVDTPGQLREASAVDAGMARWLTRLSSGAGHADERGRRPPYLSSSGTGAAMPQGTVKHFDVETRTGSILLDNQDELLIDAETFAASGLRELRLGQRVRFRIEEAGERQLVRDLNLVSL